MTLTYLRFLVFIALVKLVLYYRSTAVKRYRWNYFVIWFHVCTYIGGVVYCFFNGRDDILMAWNKNLGILQASNSIVVVVLFIAMVLKAGFKKNPSWKTFWPTNEVNREISSELLPFIISSSVVLRKAWMPNRLTCFITSGSTSSTGERSGIVKLRSSFMPMLRMPSAQ